MQIIDAEKMTFWGVEIEGSEYTYYARHGPNNWQVAMGESMEPVFFPEQLEELFQEWLTRSGETAA